MLGKAVATRGLPGPIRIGRIPLGLQSGPAFRAEVAGSRDPQFLQGKHSLGFRGQERPIAVGLWPYPSEQMWFPEPLPYAVTWRLGLEITTQSAAKVGAG